jgi:hypothetical protein
MSVSFPNFFFNSNSMIFMTDLSAGGSISHLSDGTSRINLLKRPISTILKGSYNNPTTNLSTILTTNQVACNSSTIKPLVYQYQKSKSGIRSYTHTLNFNDCTKVPAIDIIQETMLENTWIHARVTVLNLATFQISSGSQDLANFYLPTSFTQFVYYTGSQPFTNAAVTTLSATATQTTYDSSENWAALLNPDTGLAIGVFTLTTTSYVVSRTVSNPPLSTEVSFMSPRLTKAFAVNEQYQFDYYIKVGKIADIRSAFYQIPRS